MQNIFESSPGADLAPFTRLICGGIAGITSVSLTYPLDIVRTRLSIQSASFSELGDRPDKLPGMWTTLVRMYQTEGGMSALYRGIIPTVAGVAPYVRSWSHHPHPAYPFLLTKYLGWTKFYGIRISTTILDARRRTEPQRCSKTPCWCRIRSRRPNLHLPFVSFCYYKGETGFLLTKHSATFFGADSRSTPCRAWATNIRESQMPFESS